MEGRLQTVFDASPVAIVEVDLAARVRLWNRAAERIFGWPADEILGQPVPYVPPERQAEFEDTVALVRAGEAFTGLETVRRRRDGTLVDVELSAGPVRDRDGSVIGHMALFHDIGERKHQEEEARASGERLRAVIEAAPVPIVELDLDDRIQLWNPAAERTFGWSAEEVVGNVLGKTVTIIPRDREAEFEKLKLRLDRDPWITGFESVRQRRDGSLVDVEIAVAPVRDRSNQVVSFMAVYRDITEQKQQQRELQASRARIVQAADTERKRLERNLHDGAQQRLVSVSLALRVAATRLDDDPIGGRAMLAGATDELGLAMEELRE